MFYRASPKGSPLLDILQSGNVLMSLNLDSLEEIVLEDHSDQIYMLHVEEDFFSNNSFEILNLEDSIEYQGAFGFPKDSELTPLFNYHLFQLYENGVWEKLTKKHFSKPLPYEINPAHVSVLGFDNVLLPFLILGSGLGIGTLLVICEKIKINLKV